MCPPAIEQYPKTCDAIVRSPCHKAGKQSNIETGGHTMKKNIYPERSQELSETISEIGDMRKLLVVPVDFAKKEHTVQMCLGNGNYILNAPLKVYNDARGLDFLRCKIEKAAGAHGIAKRNVIVGGEDPPPFTYNFINALRLSGYKFVSVNAREGKKFRTNTRASSDNLDLNGIAQAIMNRRVTEFREFREIFCNMKFASRSRRRFVRQETAIKNRIHRTVEILFPGFMEEKSSGVTPFSMACLWLLEENFSLSKIKRMREQTLLEGLRRNRLQKPQEAVARLKALADRTLPPPVDMVSYLGRSLSLKVALFRLVRDSVFSEENEMARYLVQTPGFYLTSIPGIGVVLAGGIMAEIGTAAWTDTDRIASYAGIVPREKQTGGSEKLPVKGRLPMDANRILKDWLLQAAYHCGTTPHPAGKTCGGLSEHALMTHYRNVENREGRSRLSTAKLFLKTGARMLAQESVYIPGKWLHEQTHVSRDMYIAYFDEVLKYVNEKWGNYDLSGIPAENNYLVKWSKSLCDLKKFIAENQACPL
jgi:transposase